MVRAAARPAMLRRRHRPRCPALGHPPGGQIGSDSCAAINQLHELLPATSPPPLADICASLLASVCLRRAPHLSRVPAAHPGANLPCVLRSRPAGAIAVSSSIWPSPSLIDILLGGEGTHSAAVATSPKSKNRFWKASFASCFANCKTAGTRLRWNSFRRAPAHPANAALDAPEEKNLGLSFESKWRKPAAPSPRRPGRGFERAAQKMSADFSHQRRRSPAEPVGKFRKGFSSALPGGTLHARLQVPLRNSATSRPASCFPFPETPPSRPLWPWRMCRSVPLVRCGSTLAALLASLAQDFRFHRGAP